jgi:hypothetical protein
MKILDVCKSYFNGINEVSHPKKNDKIFVLAVLKILSYFTAFIPLAFGGIAAGVSLYGRMHKKHLLSLQDKKIANQAQKNLLNLLDVTPFLEKAKICATKYDEQYGKGWNLNKGQRTVYDKVLTYITDILNDVEFRKDPKKYVSNWNSERDEGGENFLIPDDAALSFFNKEVIPNLAI